MITSLEFDSSPVIAGEVRRLMVLSDVPPIFVGIECFREPPRPAQLRPCQECGSFRIMPGECFEITASLSVFSEKGGFLRVNIRDVSGDSREFELRVKTRGRSGGMEYAAR